MPSCDSCSAELREPTPFCPSCGNDLRIVGDATVQKAASPSSRPHGNSSSSLDHGRFLPGMMLGDRYRIVALLGKGGMGEVYRADDMKLGQTVALKLLPEALARDEGRLNRLLNEVRTARQIAHPNVCRVYDIGEIGHEHFIAMEYIDGEDLGSLLHRIGRFPKDKAIQIARQICAGLAAAHERGVLHRDLKPANVMLDEHGRARITDFGLAAMADRIAAGEAREGTPAYMSPEQLAAREVTVRSDLYSLGLVLYEVFTGKRAFEAETLSELIHLREESAPADPSQIVDDIDPAVERVILRCLDPDPRGRPASALAVAAALPGGDPLAAALAAGETPSPELLASAGDAAGIRPSVALALVSFVLLGLLLAGFLRQANSLVYRSRLEIPPESLATKARDLLANLGYTEKPVDTAWGFAPDRDLIEHVVKNERGRDRWKFVADGRPAALYFWYRESPHVMVPAEFFFPVRVRTNSPPPLVPGMKSVFLDREGRLIYLSVIPPQFEEGTDVRPPDWPALLAASGLADAGLAPEPSRWIPPGFADARQAWVGKLSGGRETIRIEAASHRGLPTHFEIIGPWTRPSRMQPAPVRAGQRIAQIIFLTLFVAIVLGAAMIARRNLRLGRGDRRGAWRLSLVVFGLGVLSMLMRATHVPTLAELGIVIQCISWALFASTLLWLMYIALEPHVRKRWPHAMISWSRLLMGRVQDPLVARDLLFGAVAGITLTLIRRAAVLATRVLADEPALSDVDLEALSGVRSMVDAASAAVLNALFFSLGLLMILLLLRIVVRKEWLAIGVLLTVGTTAAVADAAVPLFAAVLALALWSVSVFVLFRFGLVACFAMLFFSSLSNGVLLGSGFVATPGWMLVSFLAVVALYAFYHSLAGRPILQDALLER